MSDDDLEMFRSEMKDVEPLKSCSKLPLKKIKKHSPSMEARRLAAVKSAEQTSSNLSLENIPPVAPLAVLEFVRPGIQHGVFKKLRLGKYQIDARLDLHRMTVERARSEIVDFVRDCLNNEVRCALIAHGKGEGRSQPAVLKSCIAVWLPRIPDVLAFSSAQRHHGGVGAIYVLIRKSDSKQRSNWERHIGRRG